MQHTLQVDVHWEASTEWMQGDNGFWLCKYTCWHLTRVLPCCHFAAYYSFPEKKKSVPELNDQSSYIFHLSLQHYSLQCHVTLGLHCFTSFLTTSSSSCLLTILSPLQSSALIFSFTPVTQKQIIIDFFNIACTLNPHYNSSLHSSQ